MKPEVALALALITGVAIVASDFAKAHHSFAAEFDASRPVEVAGVITKVEWQNPHSFFYVDVETASGAFENWAFELASPNSLLRRGWKRDSLNIGDDVVVVGYRAKDGSNKGNATVITLANGEQLNAGSSATYAEQNGGQ